MNARHVALYLWWTIEHVWGQRVALSRMAAEPFLSRRRGERVSVRLCGGSVKAKANSGPNRIRPPCRDAAAEGCANDQPKEDARECFGRFFGFWPLGAPVPDRCAQRGRNFSRPREVPWRIS